MKPRPFRVSDCRPGPPEPECPCQWVCDDCQVGRHQHCFEVRLPQWAEWRRTPRPEEWLRVPGPWERGKQMFVPVWVKGIACRYICQCSCWRITLAAQPKRAQRAVALTLFDEEELS